MSMITVETLCTLLKYALERMKHQGVNVQSSVQTTDSKCLAANFNVIHFVLHIQLCYYIQMYLRLIIWSRFVCLITACDCFCNKYFDFF